MTNSRKPQPPGAAPYSCLQCGAKFATLQALGGHKSVHTGKRKTPKGDQDAPPTPPPPLPVTTQFSAFDWAPAAKRQRTFPDSALLHPSPLLSPLHSHTWLQNLAAASLLSQSFPNRFHSSSAPGVQEPGVFTRFGSNFLPNWAPQGLPEAGPYGPVSSSQGGDFSRHMASLNASTSSFVGSPLRNSITTMDRRVDIPASPELPAVMPRFSLPPGCYSGAAGFLEAAALKVQALKQRVSPPSVLNLESSNPGLAYDHKVVTPQAVFETSLKPYGHKVAPQEKVVTLESLSRDRRLQETLEPSMLGLMARFAPTFQLLAGMSSGLELEKSVSAQQRTSVPQQRAVELEKSVSALYVQPQRAVELEKLVSSLEGNQKIKMMSFPTQRAVELEKSFSAQQEQCSSSGDGSCSPEVPEPWEAPRGSSLFFSPLENAQEPWEEPREPSGGDVVSSSNWLNLELQHASNVGRGDGAPVLNDCGNSSSKQCAPCRMDAGTVSAVKVDLTLRLGLPG